MKYCTNCCNKTNLKKIKIKGGCYGFDAYICPRCWHVDLYVDSKTRNKLVKRWAKQEENKALSIIIKEAN